MSESNHQKINKINIYVGVSSGSELLDSTVWANVFNDVIEGSFVQKGFTTRRLLLATFGLHQIIQTFLTKEENKINDRMLPIPVQTSILEYFIVLEEHEHIKRKENCNL